MNARSPYWSAAARMLEVTAGEIYPLFGRSPEEAEAWLDGEEVPDDAAECFISYMVTRRRDDVESHLRGIAEAFGLALRPETQSQRDLHLRRLVGAGRPAGDC